MMKPAKIALLSVLLLGATMSVSAQISHYVGAYAQAGEASLMPTGDETELATSLGFGAGIGATYELRAGKYFIMDLGLGIHPSYNVFKIAGSKETLRNMTDSQGDVFDYVYNITDRRDRYTNLSLQVPVLFGCNFGRVYFLGGVKADLSCLVRDKTSMYISTEGVYKQFIDPLTNMPEHYFYDQQYTEQRASVKFDPTLMASFEVGMRIGEIYKGTGYDIPKQKIQYRLAMFFDYGIIDIHRPGSKPAIQLPSTINTANALEGITYTDILSTENVCDEVHPFMIGLKFTVLFQMPNKKRCVMCEESRPKRSGYGLLE